ncbi:SurA N-terminal domain-containing protein [Uliginosibacterium flavum]|uniref:Periplasmic chaperone PpiD n=1 Tax=Uliginosibacterium flavum TaxID=1396831 RepID=A0ABV2TGA3_9RHOO
MFDVVRNNPKIAQIILGVLTIPLALFGIESYFSNRGGNDVAARVGSVDIVSQQLDAAVRDQEGALREQMGAAFDRSVLESPEFRNNVLDRLINEAAVKTTIRESKMVVPDSQVQAFIKARPEFQENGQFSLRLYDSMIAMQGKTRDGFQQQVRESIAQNQLLAPVVQSAVTPQATAERWIALDNEERTISELVFDAKSLMAGVKLSPDAAKAYYDANQAQFQLAEQVKLEYVQLSTAEIAKKIQVSDEDARNWYKENIKSLEQAQKRRASHILVQVDAAAKADVKAAARKKAEELLAKVKAAPGKFAAIAKESSDDKGSAEKGGDLGSFAYGDMVKEFSDAAYALNEKEISGVVESEFGYHIIMLTEAAKTKSFEDSKAEAVEGARQQAATKRFTELADQFSNLVNDQPDSLKPVSEKLSLTLVQTDWLSRSALPAGVLQDPKLQAVLFSSDSIANRLNTEAVALGENVIVSARIVEYKPASVKPLEQVAAEVEAFAKAEEAAKLAKSNGEAALAKLTAGEALTAASWKAARAVKRSTAGLSGEARKAVFGAKTDKFPAYAGIVRNQDYVIYRIDSVSAPKVADDAARIKDIRQRYAMALGEEDLRAYISGVRARLGVKITEVKK